MWRNLFSSDTAAFVSRVHSGDMSPNVQVGIRCPFKINNQRMKTLVEQKPYYNVREMSQIMIVSVSAISDNLKKFSKMKNVDK